MIPSVDPAQPFDVPDWLAMPYIAFARTPVGRWIGINVASRVDPTLLRLTRGRLSVLAIYPHVRLTTIGRRSGEPRTVPLLYWTRGDEVLLMASSFGRDQHPAWFHNISANPKVTLASDGSTDPTPQPYDARVVTDQDERERIHTGFVQLYPGYGDYLERAATIDRTIPVISLTPA